MTTEECKYIDILLCVETNDIAQTDDCYFTWLMKAYFDKFLRENSSKQVILYDFAHMGTKTKYNSVDFQRKIKKFKRESTTDFNYVIYCFDGDSESKKDTDFLNSAYDFCNSQENSKMCVSFKEIENVFGIKLSDYANDKVLAAKHFRKYYPKKETINKTNCFVSLDVARSTFGTTNFCKIIEDILEETKETINSDIL